MPDKPTYEELEKQLKESEEAEGIIRESEKKYRSLVENSLQGVLIIQDYRVIFANTAFVKMSGYSVEELLSMPPEELMKRVHPDDYDIVWKRHEDRLLGKPVESFYEMRLCDRNGKTIWVEASVILSEYQGKQAVQCTFIDITDRKAYEEQLHDNEEKYQMLLENAGVPIIFFSYDGHIWMLNSSGAKELGGKPIDFIGKTVYDVLPDYADGIMHRIKKTIETDSGKTYEDFTIVKGQKRCYISSFHPVADKDGNITGCQIISHNITDKKEAETALRESEEKFKLIFQNANDGIVYIDMIGTILDVNRKTEEIVGIRKEEMLGRKFDEFDVLPTEEKVIRTDRFKKIMDGDPLQTSELELIRKNGTNVIVEVNAAIIKIEEAQTMVAIIRDITERKQIEKALQENEKRLKSILDNMEEGITVTDMEGRIIDINKAISMQFGYSKEEVIGKTPLDVFLHEADTTKFHSRVKSMLSGESVTNEEYLGKRKDGKTFPISVSLSAIKDDIGNPENVIAIHRDITFQKDAEKELRESEEKFRMIFENANDEIVYMGKDGNIIDVNDKVEEIWGYKREEVIGRNYAEFGFVSEAEMENMATLFSDLFEGKPVQIHEMKAMRRDGSTVYVEINSRAVMRNNEVIGFLSIVRDITNRKLAEDEKKNLEAMLQQAQKLEAIGTLAGGIAHDFNNILTPIMGFTEMTINTLSEKSKNKRKLDEVLKAADRAKSLVKQLLAFGRPNEENMFPMQLQPIIKEVVKLIRSTIPTTIEITTHIDQDCGAVLVDATQIHQLVMNLCTNAYQSMQEKGGVLNVSLNETSIGVSDYAMFPDMTPGPYVQLIISDTGHGMGRETLKKIFEPYFTTKPVGVGSGIGLSVVHGIVKNHSGGINVYSEVGKGSTFKVFLPIAAMGDKKETVTSDKTIIPVGSERILVVDDEYAIVQMMKDMLENIGYHITPRTSSIEALEAFKANHEKYDMVITDQTMPNMTGVALSRKMLEIRPDIPIILCTGFSEQIDEDRAQQLGIKGYLMKPVTLKEVANKIRKIFD